MQTIESKLNQIKNQIQQTAKTHGREPKSIQLLAVSKKKPASDIRAAYLAGQKSFGENYLQEATDKIQQLSDLDISWHFIGAIQSNKTKQIASSFDWVHCVDRQKIAQRLSDQRPSNLPKLNVCIQVNLDQQASKAGVALTEVASLAMAIKDLPRVNFRGLMSIPAPRQNFDLQRAAFARLRDCLDSLQRLNIGCDTLSMGMSGDMDAAIAEGSTMVRIGTALFGGRNG